MASLDIEPGDRVEWTDSDVDPEVRRVGRVVAVLSAMLLVLCDTGYERFVMKNNRTLRRPSE